MVKVGGNDEDGRFCQEGIEVRNLLGTKTPVQEPTELNYEVEIYGETEAQKGNRDIRNQE